MASLALVEREEMVVQTSAATWVEHIEAIHAEMQHRCRAVGIEAAVRVGQELIRAKADLGADYKVMVKKLTFGTRMAELYVNIAEHPVLSDPKCISLLPASVGALADLARLPAPVVLEALDAGRVTCETKRSDLPSIFKGQLPVPAPRGERSTTSTTMPTAAPVPEELPTACACAKAQHLDALVSAVEVFFACFDEHSAVKKHKGLRSLGNVLREALEAIPGRVAPAAEAEDRWRCPSCEVVHDEDELVKVRECSNESCGTVFADVDDARNCVECNRPFTRLVHDRGCPECGDEGECEEVSSAS